MTTATKPRRKAAPSLQTKLLIDGKWRDSASGKTFETINPATEEVIAQVAEGDAADIDLAVKAARKAFDSGPWRKMDARDRGRLMNKLADLIEENIDELAALETLDNGKPICESRSGDLPLVIDCLRYYAGWADKIHGQTIPIRGNYFCYTKREPVGVVGQIIPWNFPMLMVAWKWGPALAAGCTIVMKPAEQTPLTLPADGRAGAGGRLPGGRDQHRPRLRRDRRRRPGQASGRRQGRLHRRPRSARSSCGTPPRRSSGSRSSSGGKSPNIVFADADLDAAVNGCHARPVPEPGPMLLRRQPAVRRGEGLRQVRREAGRPRSRPQARRPVRSRDPAGPAGRQGPVRQDHALHRHGQAAGGPVRHRRRAVRRRRASSSSRPIFADVKDDMAIANDEIFGPVMSVLKFKDIDEVVERANTTDYGLAAAVWTRDIGKAHAIADRVRAGTVWVNCYDVFDAAAPFGGFKMQRHRPRAGREGPRQLHRAQDGDRRPVERKRRQRACASDNNPLSKPGLPRHSPAVRPLARARRRAMRTA